MDAFQLKKQQHQQQQQQQQQIQQQHKSFKLLKPVWGTAGAAEQTMGFSITKLALVVGAACACSFFYIVILVLTSQPCNRSLYYYQCKDGDCKNTTTLPSLQLHQNQRSKALSTDSHLQLSSNASSTQQQQQQSVILVNPDTHETSLANIVFGIAASASLWEKRKEYVKLWWRPDEMRGFVFLEKKVRKWSNTYPPYRISAPINKFNYTNKRGNRAAIRISRIVSETFRIGLPNVHWFVMGDDDTVFVPENLVRILSKYDHRRYYYIGSHSESHTQNLQFSYNMAYGGGGFAISYPLAEALEKMQDSCLHRYPYLFGSDDRMQACMAELGVPLTKEPGFHQFDIYGDASGLLSAHPVTPLITLHHLDVIDPVFPNMTQVQALKHLSKSIAADPGGILQQSICYDKWRRWSFSVSWGYTVNVVRGIIPPRELELPTRTFISWYRRHEDSGYPFSSRPVSSEPCEQPVVFFLKNVTSKDPTTTLTTYNKENKRRRSCKWKMASPAGLDWIRVTKERTDKSWHQGPRRQCCRIQNSDRKNVEIEVGPCRIDEIIA